MLSWDTMTTIIKGGGGGGGGGLEVANTYTVFLSSCGLLGVGVACVNTLKMVPF